MKFYTNRAHNRLIYTLVPIGLLVSLAVPMYLEKDLVHLLMSNLFIYLVLGYVVYINHKQAKIPIFEIDNDMLRVNDLRNGKKEVPLHSIAGLKRFMWFGRKLNTLYGDVVIPLASLHVRDRQKLLSVLNLKDP
ncbi:MAG: hypothetical protein AB2551_16385 [Candidatus Thiodiazotropha sp.]